MKLVQSLASVVTGVVMLATVGNSSASAAEFNLSGVLDGGDTLSGTYSYSGDTLAPSSNTEYITSFSVSIDNSQGTTIDTFNTGNSIAFIENASNNPDLKNLDLLGIYNTSSSDSVALYFPSTFTGSGDISNNTASFFSSMINPQDNFLSASSTPVVTQSVPEPSTIPGVLAAATGLLAMQLKKYKKERASQAA